MAAVLYSTSIRSDEAGNKSPTPQQANGRLWRAAQYRGGQLPGNPNDLLGLGCATNVSFLHDLALRILGTNHITQVYPAIEALDFSLASGRMQVW
jgi:hypothetical protein